MLHIQAFDMTIIAVYMVFMLVIGFYMSRRVRTATDFFVAGRSLGMFVITATVCATIIGGGALIGRGGIVYDQGAVAIWLAVPYLVGMLFFSYFAGRIHSVGKKHGIISIPDLMERRFGRTAKLIVAVLIAYTMMATVGSQISATATILRIVGSEWGLTYETGAIIATLIFVCYTGVSGLFGVVYTDTVQFVILLVSVYIILPIVALGKVGGMGGLVASVPPAMWNLKPDATLLGYIFTNLIFTLAGAEMCSGPSRPKVRGWRFAAACTARSFTVRPSLSP